MADPGQTNRCAKQADPLDRASSSAWAEADGDKLPPPPFLMWATFNDCNFKCKYCPIPDELLRPQSAAFKRFYDTGYHDKILSFFRRLHEHSGSWIVCLTGGEPLLMPNLEYLTSNLIQIGHKIRYNTNLSINLLRRPGWFEANPPSGIDLLMVSIHDESLPQIDALYERICDLKSRGYQVIVRMVCTPDKLEMLDDLETRFRACDVTLTPLPEIEFRSANSEIGALPRAYTPEQRSFLESRFKGYGELAMLYGGIDVTGRTCFAGSRMLFMHSHSVQHVAQISPCNLTSHLVMADVAEFIGPEPARSIESLLVRGPAPCLRPNRRCDCPGIVENDIIADIPARHRYKAMAAGYVPALGATATAWIRENGVKFGQDTTAHKGSSVAADNRARTSPLGLVAVLKKLWKQVVER